MTTGGLGTPSEYFTEVVTNRVSQAGMELTDEARGYLTRLVEAGAERDLAAAENGVEELAERIVQGAQVVGLTGGDRMDLLTLQSIRRWFCPLAPWC